MELREVLEVLAANRGNHIVITTMASIGIWARLSENPLDFAYIPSAMGHGSGLGLGLALAQPDRGVIVVNGDGSTLMNLGSLVTLANNPAKVYLMIIDNGLYEVTGGQPVVGAGKTDFGQLARGAGIQRTYDFDSIAAWQNTAKEALSGPGPVAMWFKVSGKRGEKTPAPPHPMADQIAPLQEALGVKEETPTADFTDSTSLIFLSEIMLIRGC